MSSRTLTLEAASHPKAIDISLFEGTTTVRQVYTVIISPKELAQLCRDVVELLNKSNERGVLAGYIANNLKKTGQVLYDQLLPDPVKKKLQQAKSANLIILMDDKLVEVPWELLYDGQQYLGLKFNLGRIVKTKQMVHENTRTKKKSPAKMLILADPTADLRAAKVEAMVVGDVINKKPDLVHLSSKSIGISRLYLKKNLRSFDLLHYAGHAVYDFKQPQQTGWLLQDGRLTVEDICQMGASSNFPLLVFSNSCDSAYEQSGFIDPSVEQRFYGLATAFLISGVRFFIGALWKLSDEAALFYAREFYKQLLNGKSIGAAVRLARTYLIKNYGEENIAWASYVLYGEPTHALFPKR